MNRYQKVMVIENIDNNLPAEIKIFQIIWIWICGIFVNQQRYFIVCAVWCEVVVATDGFRQFTMTKKDFEYILLKTTPKICKQDT